MTRSEKARLAGIESGKVRSLPATVIHEMRRLRAEGYAYGKIAIILSENDSTVFRLCRDVEVK